MRDGLIALKELADAHGVVDTGAVQLEGFFFYLVGRMDNKGGLTRRDARRSFTVVTELVPMGAWTCADGRWERG